MIVYKLPIPSSAMRASGGSSRRAPRTHTHDRLSQYTINREGHSVIKLTISWFFRGPSCSSNCSRLCKLMSQAHERLDADVDNAFSISDVFTHQPFELWSCLLVLSFLRKSQSVQWSCLLAGLFAEDFLIGRLFHSLAGRDMPSKYSSRLT